MDKEEYMALLCKAKECLPGTANNEERFQPPDAEVLLEGKTTILRNLGDISDAINRKPEQLFLFLLKEMGTAGNIDGKRGIFKGKLMEKQLAERIKEYIETYVICTECNRPDTRLVKDGRTLVLECDACGAHRPVKVKKAARVREEPAIKEGETYELTIQDVGRKGDGIAKVGKYIIYVPATTKGNTVKVRINKISGNIAFGSMVRE